MAHCESTAIFNSNRGKRLQYALDLELLPAELGQKARLLEQFLVRAYQECTPRNWVCLHSLPNCHEQQPHSDYCRADIAEAVAQDPRAYPFECTCITFVSLFAIFVRTVFMIFMVFIFF